MRKLAVLLLFRALRALGATFGPTAAAGVPVPPLGPDDLGPFARVAADAVALARRFGDRQNSDSTLTAGEATKVVTTLLSAGNLMAAAARAAGSPPCSTNPSTTPPTSPPAAT